MDKMDLPIGGPATWDEALADIKESERDIEAGRGTSWNHLGCRFLGHAYESE